MSFVKDKTKPKTTNSSSKEKKNSGGAEKTLDATNILTFLRNRAQNQQRLPTSKLGVPEGWRKMTIAIRDENHEKLKNLSYSTKVDMKDLLDELLERFFLSVQPKP